MDDRITHSPRARRRGQLSARRRPASADGDHTRRPRQARTADRRMRGSRRPRVPGEAAPHRRSEPEEAPPRGAGPAPDEPSYRDARLAPDDVTHDGTSPETEKLGPYETRYDVRRGYALDRTIL